MKQFALPSSFVGRIASRLGLHKEPRKAGDQKIRMLGNSSAAFSDRTCRRDSPAILADILIFRVLSTWTIESSAYSCVHAFLIPFLSGLPYESATNSASTPIPRMYVRRPVFITPPPPSDFYSGVLCAPEWIVNRSESWSLDTWGYASNKAFRRPKNAFVRSDLTILKRHAE
jgi:hypothetical protein